MFECFGGKFRNSNFSSDTSHLQGNFLCSRNVSGRFAKMSFSCDIDILQIVSCRFSGLSSTLQTRAGSLMEGKNKSNQLTLHCLVDGTIWMSVSSASRFRRTPKSAMPAGFWTIRRRLFYPRCPLTLSPWLLIHIRTLSLYLCLTNTFMMMDFLREASRAILLTWGLLTESCLC